MSRSSSKIVKKILQSSSSPSSSTHQNVQQKQLKLIRDKSSYAEIVAENCPHLTGLTTTTALHENAARPYNEVPGPKPLPLLGNTWR